MSHRLSLVTALCLLPATRPATASAQQLDIATTYRAAADSLIRGATSDSAAYRRLGRLVDTFGHRISGSRSLESAIDWILDGMKADELENVRGEPVMVPRWVRGAESAELVKPRAVKLAMLGLGGSVGTPKAGITAPVLVVGSLEELERRGAEAKGKIVLIDTPFTDYAVTRRVRSDGPSAAARVGAVACLIRSVASSSIRSPHTGATRYDSTVARIPAAALSVEDAMMLHRFQDRGEHVVVTLRMSARTLPDAPSRNVVAELVGREKPDEIVVLGGHIDSWDVGQGAMDDGGGSVAAWEAVRLMKRLGLRPRRTVRVVLWTNEENGSRGADAYAQAHAGEIAKHVLAMESDNGAFNPRGYVLSASDSAAGVVQQVARLLQPIDATGVQRVAESPAADITPLAEAGVPAMELDVDSSRYFWYHHSEGDTLDKLDPAELARCVAAMAVMAYVVADLPDAMPHGATN
ncbi:MAG TPA: M28 family metallopeptidase [Gemmatimonadales bacterium]|nr:M28 family metallopeptidase [Gemmatimonadales bacterium]